MKRQINAILGIALLSPTLSWAACEVKSGPNTDALVELYTSEGCSSCPPADKRLSQFPTHDYSLELVVPISLREIAPRSSSEGQTTTITLIPVRSRLVVQLR